MTTLLELKNTATMVCFSEEEQKENKEMIDTFIKEQIKIEQEIAHIRTVQTNLFGIELEAQRILERRVNLLINKVKKIESESKIATKEAEARICKFANKYHRLSWEPFANRTPTGFPIFCIWNVFTGRSLYLGRDKILFTSSSYCPTNLELLTSIGRHHYALWDVSKVLGFLNFRYSGTIPDDIKENIKKAKKDFEEQIFLVQETKEKNIKISKDPLIVGLCKHNDLWLIDSFEETSLEETLFFTQP